MSPRGLRNWFGRFRARDIRGNLVIGGNTGLIYQVYGGGPPPAPPTIPWAPSLPGPDAPFATFNLLSWKFRLVPGLIGREAEAARLHDWALTGPALRIRFLTGPGGAGKTRLAAEVASALPGWHAGFVPLHTETPLPWSDRGVLIILDYPEAWPEQVRTLLREAATAGAPRAPVRILLLSRSPMSHWEDEIGRCKAEALCDTQDVGIGALAPMAAAEVFRQAVARLASDRAQPAPPFDAAVLDAWLARNPKLHGLPLLTTAAAIHFMNEPGPTLGLEAAEIVAALVRRERTRLDDAGRAHGLGARGAARVVGLAALRDGLDAPALRRLAAPELEMELPEPARLLTTVRDLGWWQTDRLPAPEPDIVAAELLRQELAAAGDRGGARVWAVLGEAGAVRIELLDRRLHDMVTLYGPGGDAILRDGLVAAVAGRGDRAQAWRVFFNTDARSFRLAPVGIAVGQALLTEPGLPDPERAEVLNNLSVHLSDAGNGEAALAASRAAADLCRRLAREDPARFAADLATSLNTLSNCLGDAGHDMDALAAIREAADIRRLLASAQPARFAADFAGNLSNLSGRLSDAGDGVGALAAIREAMGIHRRLAGENPARFVPDLATSLSNLSNRLLDAGDARGALAAIREAVDIHRRLAGENPARFAPDLATSLNNLSNRLGDADDHTGALAAIREAVDIQRRLAGENPARFAPDLAMSLNNLSNHLGDTGDRPGALAAIREAADMRRRLAGDNPVRFGPGLATSLNNLLDCPPPVRHEIRHTTLPLSLLSAEPRLPLAASAAPPTALSRTSAGTGSPAPSVAAHYYICHR